MNNYLSNYILIVLLVGTGIYFTFKTEVVQVRCFAIVLLALSAMVKNASGK